MASRTSLALPGSQPPAETALFGNLFKPLLASLEVKNKAAVEKWQKELNAYSEKQQKEWDAYNEKRQKEWNATNENCGKY